MNSEQMYDDQSCSTRKKKKRQKEKKKTHNDKQSIADGDYEYKQITEAIPLDFVPESKRRKKHKKKKHNSEDDDDECKKDVVGKGKLKEKYLNVDDVDKKKTTHDREHTTPFSSDVEVEDIMMKVKKKRKKDKIISTDIPQAGCDNNEPLKKKRKSKLEPSASEITPDGLSVKQDKVDTLLNECKQEKSKKKRKGEMQPEACVETTDVATLKNISSTCEEASANYHKKKKKKHSKCKVVSSVDDLESSVELSKHKNISAITCDDLKKNNGCISEQEDQGRPNKKHKSEKSLGINVEDEHILSSICEEGNGSHLKKKKKEKHSKHRDTLSSDEPEQKSKKKSNYDSLSTVENINGGVSQVHKAKSIFSSIAAQVEVNLATSELSNSNQCEEESIQHHNKQRKQSNSKDSLVDENRQQKGESNESYLDQTHLKKPAFTSACTAIVEGQWQGNLFENSERQNKFLRLMGGMKKSSVSGENMDVATKDVSTSDSIKKKGLFKSLTSLIHTSNTAMSATAAASLNQKLEDEYSRAMNFKLSGKVGTGFGYVQDPAEKKTFHIDINKSKSIKFDD